MKECDSGAAARGLLPIVVNIFFKSSSAYAHCESSERAKAGKVFVNNGIDERLVFSLSNSNSSARMQPTLHTSMAWEMTMWVLRVVEITGECG